jgi:hypothetical protein
VQFTLRAGTRHAGIAVAHITVGATSGHQAGGARRGDRGAAVQEVDGDVGAVQFEPCRGSTGVGARARRPRRRAGAVARGGGVPDAVGPATK